MKRDDFINELLKLPQDAEVVIFDWRKSISGDDENLGVYEPIVVEENDGDLILLSFDNVDYSDDGNRWS
jgi:hypothetical protein